MESLAGAFNHALQGLKERDQLKDAFGKYANRHVVELVTQGKIRHAGMSNYDVPQMPALRRFGPVQTLQPPYHLFRRDIVWSSNT